MKPLAVTQRVAVKPRYGERRDCLDQAWARFIAACGFVAVPMPNMTTTALALCQAASVEGLVFTGGNDLVACGGDAPERDETESALLDFAERHQLPVLGVCRGMQVLQHRFGVPLRRVEGHVAARQTICIEGRPAEVNSYHRIGATETRPPLEVWARADDGVVKAVRHPGGRMLGIMWHPERMDPFAASDIGLFGRFFGAA